MNTGILSDVLAVVIYCLNIYTLILFVYILLTWFRGQGWAEQTMAFLSPIAEPYLGIFRSFIPPLGMMDISPIVAIFVLQIIQRLLITVGSSSIAYY